MHNFCMSKENFSAATEGKKNEQTLEIQENYILNTFTVYLNSLKQTLLTLTLGILNNVYLSWMLLYNSIC